MEKQQRTSTLNLDSSLQEALRQMFLHKAEAVFFHSEGLFVCKEHLIAMLEKGWGSLTLRNLPRQYRSLYDIGNGAVAPPSGTVISLHEYGSTIGTGEKSLREAVEPPPWWQVPLPLLSLRGESVSLNREAARITGEISMTVRQIRNALKTHNGCLTLATGKHPQMFLLTELERDIYLLEDVSQEATVAEDVLAWAAIGKGLRKFLLDHGFELSFTAEGDHAAASQPERGDTTLVCCWEETPVGRITLNYPESWETEQDSDDPC
ncbi:MAG: hypothetical protein K9L28_00680 [Synergistales bacterium]|nr:hypothetical protein [Synergistales bacterium]